MTITRRMMLGGGALAFGGAMAAGRPGAAQTSSLFPFADDQGRSVYNYRLPAELSVSDVPGVVWAGPSTADAILVEFFDYNCPHCRAAGPEIDAMLRNDPALRLGLVNNPVFGLGSVQAAKVQQGVLRGYGPAKAFEFHGRLLARRGPTDGPVALRVAADLGLDAKQLEQASDLPRVGEVVARQARYAAALGFNVTPSFMIDGIGIPGYPGPKALARAVGAVRACDKLAC